MAKVFYNDSQNPAFQQQAVLSKLAQINSTFEQSNKKDLDVALVTSDGILNDPNAISFYLANGTSFVGSNQAETTEVYAWMELFNTKLLPLLRELYGQISGSKNLQPTKYQYCTINLLKLLKNLDDHLKTRTYFVGDEMTLVDILLCCQLDHALRCIIKESYRKKVPHFQRWFVYIRSTSPFVEVLGNMVLCSEQPIQLKFPEQKAEEKVEEEPPKELPKQQQNSETNLQKVEETEAPESKVEQQPEQKEVTIEVQIEPIESKKEEEEAKEFKLAAFAQEFASSENKDGLMEELWKCFPHEGWSIWKVNCSHPIQEDNAEQMLSDNMETLDFLKEHGFGSFGIYQDEATAEVSLRGVMIWEGTQILNKWKEHVSFNPYSFERLDTQNPDHQGLICGYWKGEGHVEGLKTKFAKLLI